MRKFESKSEFVTTGVEVLGVDQRTQRQLDSRPKVLGVGHAQLTAVVYLR